MLLFYLSIIDDNDEKSTFELLYIKHKNLMYNIANNILHDTYLSEDAVHQAFLNIIPHLSKIKIKEVETAKTRGYLIVVTRNAAIDMLRKKHKCISLDDLDFNFSLIDDNLDTHMEYIETIKRINQLPDKYKDVLLLKYVYECDNKEIQSILKIKEAATIRKRIQRAREMLED